MTGRIEELATAEKPGRIVTSSGPSRFQFAYRQPTGKSKELSMGQIVSFELERSSPEFAVSVRPKELDESSDGDRDVPREIRYQGFEQTKNIRKYRFQAWRSHEENEEAIVTVDLGLFRRHGVGIQEGPEICLRFVKAEFQEADANKALVWTRALTDKEMVDHLESHPTSKKKRARY